MTTLPKTTKPLCDTSTESGSLRVLKSPTHFGLTVTSSDWQIPTIESKLIGASTSEGDIVTTGYFIVS